MLIKLTNTDKVAEIDDEDYELVKSHSWHGVVDRNGIVKYAATAYKIGSKWGVVQMHRLILGLPKRKIDHIDGNGLNNRRGNLRQCSTSQNAQNRPKAKGKYSSQYKGVTWHKRHQKWYARIKLGGKITFLGLYRYECEAANAYNQAALLLFGKFAKLNTIECSTASGCDHACQEQARKILEKNREFEARLKEQMHK